MKRLVQALTRWTVVDIDEERNQVTVPDGAGGRFYVKGTGDKAIASAAQYTVQHGPGRDWGSRASAVQSLAIEWKVDADGWLS